MTSSGPMSRALAAAFKDADLPERYAAGKALARQYAALLDASRGTPDEPVTFETIGPKMLATLTALGLTVAGRKEEGKTGGSTGSPVIDELRARRSAR